MQGGRRTIGGSACTLLAAGTLAFGHPAAHAASAAATAKVGVSIVVPVRLESLAVSANNTAADAPLHRLVVDVSTEGTAPDPARVTFAFN